MAKYRKKPVIVDAVLWTGENINEIREFGQNIICVNIIYTGIKRIVTPKIKTTEGIMSADIGDYIIKGTRGEFYPCKPNMFKDCYELVEE